MAEFSEVMKQFNRMCKYNRDSHNCSNCPIKIKADNNDNYCINYFVDNYVDSEEIIMDWAKEHPIKTNAEKFKEVFGFGLSLDTMRGDTSCGECIYFDDDAICINNCDECKYADFWDKEYSGAIEW